VFYGVTGGDVIVNVTPPVVTGLPVVVVPGDDYADDQ